MCDRRKIARERIRILLELADRVYPVRPDLAIRYGEIARTLSIRHRVKIPRKWKYRFCKKCKMFLYPGITAKIRLRKRGCSHVVVHCMLCGSITRYPYKP